MAILSSLMLACPQTGPSSHEEVRSQMVSSIDQALSEAKRLEHAGEPEQAILVLERATQRHLGSARGWAALGGFYYRYHRTEEAADALETSLSLDAEQADVHWTLGTLHRSQTQAQQAYEQALRVDPSHHGALFNLASIHQQAKRYKQAEQLLKRAVRQDESSYDALGRIYMAQERWQDALQAFDRALAHATEDGATTMGVLNVAMLNHDRGTALMELGRDKTATASLIAARENYQQLAMREYGRHGDHGHGVLQPQDRQALARVHYKLARIAGRNGQSDEAIGLLRSAVEKLPTLRDEAREEPDLAEVWWLLPGASELR